jgi:hypothetical protein
MKLNLKFSTAFLFSFFGFSFVFQSSALAVTRGQFGFTSEQAVISMSSHNLLGDLDPGPAKLYEDLKIAPQNSLMGKGKVLHSSHEEMTFIVAERRPQKYDVSIVLKKGTMTHIDSFKKFAEIRATGEEAAFLFAYWKSRENIYEFANDTGSLRILATPDLFLLTYQE